MEIRSIGPYSAKYAKAGTAKADATGRPQDKKAEQAVAGETAQQSQKPNQDAFVKSTGAGQQPVTYTKNSARKGLSSEQVQTLQQAEEARTQSFINMLKSMVVKQGQKSNLTLFGMDLFVTPEQSAQAQAAISEGGEYSVDAVAGRIMDMAKALSGGDPSKIGLLREAVEKGFQAAGVELGGELPSISQQTHAEVMRRFDEWASEANGAAGGETEA